METCVKNLSFDLVSGREIYDEELGRIVNKNEAEEAIRKVIFEKLGLTKDSTDKQIRRALKSEKALEVFQVIEETIEYQIKYGFHENEFFNTYVDTRNLADGDRNDFWVDDEVLLTVSKVSGDHHDLKYCRVCIA